MYWTLPSISQRVSELENELSEMEDKVRQLEEDREAHFIPKLEVKDKQIQVLNMLDLNDFQTVLYCLATVLTNT